MFSWICPNCGKDNQPSAVRCGKCGFNPEEAASAEAAPAESANVTQEIPIPAPPAPPRAVRVPVAAAVPLAPAPRPASGGTSVPTWLLTVVFFFAIVGVGAGIYFLIQYMSGDRPARAAAAAAVPDAPAAKSAGSLRKYVEVVGIRIVESARKKPEARFIVVNHSPNELDDISANVTLKAANDSVGTFAFKIASIGPYESKELTEPLDTKLKFYELPDWQNATPELELTQP